MRRLEECRLLARTAALPYSFCASCECLLQAVASLTWRGGAAPPGVPHASHAGMPRGRATEHVREAGVGHAGAAQGHLAAVTALRASCCWPRTAAAAVCQDLLQAEQAAVLMQTKSEYATLQPLSKWPVVLRGGFPASWGWETKALVHAHPCSPERRSLLLAEHCLVRHRALSPFLHPPSGLYCLCYRLYFKMEGRSCLQQITLTRAGSGARAHLSHGALLGLLVHRAFVATWPEREERASEGGVPGRHS